MNDTTKVLELLEELENLTEEASGFPLTGKILVDPDDIRDIIRDIRLALPEDIKQAMWVRDQKDAILKNAKVEYDRIISEANEEARYLVETSEINLKAKKLAAETIKESEMKSRILTLKTYDYVDKILYDMQLKMEEINMKYIGEMYTNLEKTFTGLNETLVANRDEIKHLAEKTQNDSLE